ncbi:MAG: SH3 domain-containing protein [Pseudomonadota bacterium]
MKRFDIMLLLVGLAVLNTACAEENGDAKKTVTVAQTGDIATRETTSVAMNTGTKARETGTTRSAVDLMATPYRDAKPAGQLPSNTTVDILERRGGWLRISAQGKTGWARLHQVRAGEGPEAKKSGEGLAMLRNVGKTGRSGSQGIVATTGIRGLSAEELKSAQPNPKAVESMEASRASDTTARDFARSAGLKEKDVPFLSQE